MSSQMATSASLNCKENNFNIYMICSSIQLKQDTISLVKIKQDQFFLNVFCKTNFTPSKVFLKSTICLLGVGYILKFLETSFLDKAFKKF